MCSGSCFCTSLLKTCLSSVLGGQPIEVDGAKQPANSRALAGESRRSVRKEREPRQEVDSRREYDIRQHRAERTSMSLGTAWPISTESSSAQSGATAHFQEQKVPECNCPSGCRVSPRHPLTWFACAEKPCHLRASGDQGSLYSLRPLTDLVPPCWWPHTNTGSRGHRPPLFRGQPHSWPGLDRRWGLRPFELRRETGWQGSRANSMSDSASLWYSGDRWVDCRWADRI